MSVLEAARHQPFLKELFLWYRKNGRHNMPWRKTKDPYAILVSEFMLQQTTVATVKPYYDRFLKYFPTLTTLAESDLDDVLALWSGLGYYARARNLWAAAKMVVDQYHGKIPQDQLALQKLPGVGFYTSGAVSSLAFNKPAVVLDGNIIRVLMRLLALEDDPQLKAIQVLLRKLSLDLGVRSLRFPGGPRDFVLAIMDLGATLCSPRSPQCHICPVSDFCLAKQYCKQETIPFREETAERPVVRLMSALVTHKNRWLLARRPEKGLFGGLWEFPGIEAPSGAEPVPTLESWFLEQTGLKARVVRGFPAFEHELTHRRYIVRSFQCEIVSKPFSAKITKKGFYKQWRWMALPDFKKTGLSSLTKYQLTLTKAIR
jgi:A/G-specific adenine glycosylase